MLLTYIGGENLERSEVMGFELKTSLLSRNSTCSFNQSEGKHFQIQCKDQVSYLKNTMPGVGLRRALALARGGGCARELHSSRASMNRAGLAGDLPQIIC